MHIIYLCYYHSAGDIGLLMNTFVHFPWERHRLSCFGYVLLYFTAEYTFVFVDIGHSLSREAQTHVWSWACVLGTGI